jgi:hypothetical protein
VAQVFNLCLHRLKPCATCVRALWSEGRERREVDVSELVPFDGVFEPLADAGYFQQVRVEPDIGTIVWPNGADLCPDLLYEHSRLGRAEPRCLRSNVSYRSAE